MQGRNDVWQHPGQQQVAQALDLSWWWFWNMRIGLFSLSLSVFFAFISAVTAKNPTNLFGTLIAGLFFLLLGLLALKLGAYKDKEQWKQMDKRQKVLLGIVTVPFSPLFQLLGFFFLAGAFIVGMIRGKR